MKPGCYPYSLGILPKLDCSHALAMKRYTVGQVHLSAELGRTSYGQHFSIAASPSLTRYLGLIRPFAPLPQR
jgi:hypothetical protein